MFPLSQTSALVLICDNISYKSPKSKEFLAHLDLSAGQIMYDKIRHLKPHLDEIIPNRKYIVHNYIRQIIKEETQIITLACGWDPMLIKMSEEFPKNSFFGIDSESINVQQKLVQQIKPNSNIFYIQEDISCIDKLIGKLKQKNWNPQKTTCLIVEGISYYIHPEPFWSSLKTLKENIKADCFICGDFLINWKEEEVSNLTKKVGSGIFEMIKKNCNHNYYNYKKADFIEKVKKLGFNKIKIWTQDEIQKQRTGTREPWKNGDGHIYLFSGESV
ncbi:MAG: class I SAM-dependent methyltransferase [Bdellovibrionaceae bacterium]|nr:class I SAM-dependent methyltransferase [Pseudobdellovibrionaceae bacterium]